MKILAVADEEKVHLREGWSRADGGRYADVDLILSAGDLRAGYLEYLVTVFNVPCLYVRGNHDESYHEHPPEGCIGVDDAICELEIPAGGAGGSGQRIRVAGLGGCMRYRPGPDQYSEQEMARRCRRLLLRAKGGRILRENGRKSLPLGRTPIDILLTHAPCYGYGDLDDLPHRGFDCYNRLLERLQPTLHCYGHIHGNYGVLQQELRHPSGTLLINVSGSCLIEL